jgi:hypothetical protein
MAVAWSHAGTAGSNNHALAGNRLCIVKAAITLDSKHQLITATQLFATEFSIKAGASETP